jgi:hypothetical protein
MLNSEGRILAGYRGQGIGIQPLIPHKLRRSQTKFASHTHLHNIYIFTQFYQTQWDIAFRWAEQRKYLSS